MLVWQENEHVYFAAAGARDNRREGAAVMWSKNTPRTWLLEEACDGGSVCI